MNEYELLKQWRESDKLEDKIKLANNGNESDINDLMKDPLWSQYKQIKKAAIILFGDNSYLDKLINDPDEDIRAAVAAKWRDKDLEILVRDKSVKVRKEVAVYASQSLYARKYFDILVNDESPEVRAIVATKVSHYGHQNNPYLDKLVHDPSADVRAEVAHYAVKKHLDILVNDPSEKVRAAVAYWGHRPKDLNILVHDSDWKVRREVALRGRDKDLDILVYDEDECVRKAVAMRGRDKDLNILVHDPNEYVREAVASVGREQCRAANRNCKTRIKYL